MKFAITVIAVILAVQAFATPLPDVDTIADDAGTNNILNAQVKVAINNVKDTATPITTAAGKNEVPAVPTNDDDCAKDTADVVPKKEPAEVSKDEVPVVPTDGDDWTKDTTEKKPETETAAISDDAPCAKNTDATKEQKPDKQVSPDHKHGLIGGLVKKIGGTVEGVETAVGKKLHGIKNKIGDTVEKTNGLLHLGLHLGL